MNIITAIFYISALIQIGLWLIFFGRFVFYIVKRKPKNSPPNGQKSLSLIICARNELKNLKKNLPSWLNQDYPSFEILIVDDGSTDGSAEWLDEQAKKQPNLRILHVKDKPSHLIGKKYALSKGIQDAQFDHLLLTDADCQPASNQWANLMSRQFKNGKRIVLGYGPYSKKPGILNAFVRYETLYTLIQYGSMAMWNMPYMGVGRNLSYEKSLFFEQNGFSKHQHLGSGDDDLFISQAANKSNTSIEFDVKAHVFSDSPENFKNFFRQKLRHMSTGKQYLLRHKIFISIFAMSHLAFFLSFVLCLNVNTCSTIFLTVAVLRFLSQYLCLGILMKKWKQEDLIIWIPIFDFLILVYLGLMSPAIFFNLKTNWK